MYTVRWHLGFYPTTLLEIAILATLAAFVVETLRGARRLDWRTPFTIPAILFLLAGAVSVAAAPDPRSALGLYRAYIIEPIAFFAVVATVAHTLERALLIVAGLGASGLLLAIPNTAVVLLAVQHHTLHVEAATPVVIYLTANAVALFLEPLIAVGGSLLLYSGDNRQRLLSLAFLLVTVPTELLTFSRGGFLALAAVFLGLALASTRRWWLFAAAIVGALAVSRIPSIGTRIAVEVDFHNPSNTLVGRFQLWSAALRMLHDHPFFGAGLSGFAQRLEPYWNATHTDRFVDPHNIVLNFWSETGLLGVVGFAWILVAGFRVSWQGRRLQTSWRAIQLGVLLLQERSQPRVLDAARPGRRGPALGGKPSTAGEGRPGGCVKTDSMSVRADPAAVPPPQPAPSRLSGRVPQLVAALGLACLYFAVMNGHFVSIDGLTMYRQALSLTYHHSLFFDPPIWWGSTLHTSTRGIGASLIYSPGLLLFPWLAPYVPTPLAGNYDWVLFYNDPLYTAVGPPVWIAITAGTAFLVGLTTLRLGFGNRASLWAMAFYGLGSPAFAASRGDFPQPLVAVCWALGAYASLRLLDDGRPRWAWLCAFAIFYGVLTRPLEGSLLLPATLLLLAPSWRRALYPASVEIGAWVAAVLVTLAVNWARFGSALNFGYGSISWSLPIWVGFPDALVSPGRGILWAFPSLVLAGIGIAVLWRGGRRSLAVALAGLPFVLFVEACQYFAWIDGWDFGFRLFQPALPLVAVLAGIGAVSLPTRARTWLPGLLLAVGILWNIPVVVTDVLGGYGAAYSSLAANVRLDAYPPIGAWRFIHHLRPVSRDDSAAVDNLWFRSAGAAGWVALVPLVLFLAASTGLWSSALRSVLRKPD